MARRAVGEGSVYRRQDGRYAGAAYVPTTSGRRKRVTVYGTTQREAQEKLTAIRRQAHQGIPTPDKVWKLGPFLDYWLAEVVQPNRHRGTHSRYEGTCRLYLKPALGTQPLAQLSVHNVQTFLNEQIQQGKSVRNVQIMRATLRAALTRAQREELVSRNVAKLVELPKTELRDIQPWNLQDIRSFLDAAKDDPLYSAFVLLILYGLRRGEVLGLRWGDVDVANGVIHIRQQMLGAGGPPIAGPVKTAYAKRDLPLLETAKHLFATQRERQSARQSDAGREWCGGGADTELVFTTRSGRPIAPGFVSRLFQRICTQAGIRRIRLHDLRHTAATMLKDLGVPARDAQLILGHSDISITQQIYQHDTLESRRTALAQVEENFNKSGVITGHAGSTMAVSNSGRSCQNLLSNHIFVDQFTSSTPVNGAVFMLQDTGFGARLARPVSTRITEVNRVMEDRRRCWIIGVVAVKSCCQFQYSPG
ncbi:MAG TPA: site-specific integrase [Pseudonocardiaceae bacterium]|nr:site-specific integrase [Pseudonocardiaceae bacterium]